jgi:hypothetical protein
MGLARRQVQLPAMTRSAIWYASVVDVFVKTESASPYGHVLDGALILRAPHFPIRSFQHKEKEVDWLSDKRSLTQKSRILIVIREKQYLLHALFDTLDLVASHDELSLLLLGIEPVFEIAGVEFKKDGVRYFAKGLILRFKHGYQRVGIVHFDVYEVSDVSESITTGSNVANHDLLEVDEKAIISPGEFLDDVVDKEFMATITIV